MEFGSRRWMKYTQDEWESKQDIPNRFDHGKGKVVRRSEEGWIRFKGKDEGKGKGKDEGKGKGKDEGKDEGKGKSIVDEGKGTVLTPPLSAQSPPFALTHPLSALTPPCNLSAMEFGSRRWMKYTQDEWESKQDIPNRFDHGKGKVVRR